MASGISSWRGVLGTTALMLLLGQTLSSVLGGGSTVWMYRPENPHLGNRFQQRASLSFSLSNFMFSVCELYLSLGLHLLQVRSLILFLGAPYFIAFRFLRKNAHSVSLTKNAFCLL